MTIEELYKDDMDFLIGYRQGRKEGWNVGFISGLFWGAAGLAMILVALHFLLEGL